jgi:hypothetical protein
MLGTAFPAAQLLLVEQPGPWGRSGLSSSHCDPTIAGRLTERFERAGIRVLAIRRPGRSLDDTPRRWARVDCRPGREGITWGSFDVDAELADLPLHPAIDPASSIFLVCTHGSHDACCALRGRPVAAALHDIRPDQVWECSHVGGDRFAANVLVLPSGMLYGSVHAIEAGPLIEAAERGRVLPGPLRGKVGLLPEAQAALAHTQQLQPNNGFRVIAVNRGDADLVTVELGPADETHRRSATVSVRVGRAPVHRLTCQMVTGATVLTYRPESIRWH